MKYKWALSSNVNLKTCWQYTRTIENISSLKISFFVFPILIHYHWFDQSLTYICSPNDILSDSSLKKLNCVTNIVHFMYFLLGCHWLCLCITNGILVMKAHRLTLCSAMTVQYGSVIFVLMHVHDHIYGHTHTRTHTHTHTYTNTLHTAHMHTHTHTHTHTQAHSINWSILKHSHQYQL